MRTYAAREGGAGVSNRIRSNVVVDSLGNGTERASNLLNNVLVKGIVKIRTVQTVKR